MAVDESLRAMQERINQNIRDLAAVTHTPSLFIEELPPRSGDPVPGTEYSTYGVLDPAVQGTSFKLRPGDQPLPVVNDSPDVQSQVIADIEERRKLGISRYGTALQPHNGRDALRDAYEEAIDLAMYLKQAILERDAARGTYTVEVGGQIFTEPQWEAVQAYRKNDAPPSV